VKVVGEKMDRKVARRLEFEQNRSEFFIVSLSGLFLVILSSLVLVLLKIERNTRNR
jgi:hypothetical protein